jgi:hypothetical protein
LVPFHSLQCEGKTRAFPGARRDREIGPIT